MAKGGNTQWVDLPLVLDWTLFTNNLPTASFVYTGAVQNTNGLMLTAGVTAYHQRLVNLLPVKQFDGFFRLKKREHALITAGFNKGVTPSDGSSRGIFWAQNISRIIELWSSTAYLQTAANTYTTQTGFGIIADGPGGMCEGHTSAGAAYAFVSTPAQSASTTASTWTVISDADFPATTTATPVFLDGYVFIASTVSGNTRRIYNSAVGDQTSWTLTGFIEAEEFSGDIKGLARHHKYVVALCADRIEFFRNAAISAPNSPLQRDPQYLTKIGCVNRATIATYGDITIFVGRDASGKTGVYKIENFKIEKISNPSIDSIMHAYGGVGLTFGTGQSFLISGTTSNLFATGYFMPQHGKIYYCLVCNVGHAGTSGSTSLSIPPAWLYDPELKIWIELACYHNDTTKTNVNVYGGWAFPYGTWMRSTDTTLQVYEFVMQNVYGGATVNNVVALSAEDFDAEVAQVGGGFAALTQGDVVGIIQTPVIDWGTSSLKSMSGVIFHVSQPFNTGTPFNAGRFLASRTARSTTPFNSVAGTTPTALSFNLNANSYTPKNAEQSYSFRNNFGLFHQSSMMIQLALRDDSMDINKIALRITPHEEQ